MAGQKPRDFDAIMDLHFEQVAEGSAHAAPIFLRPNTFAHVVDTDDIGAYDIYLYDARIARVFATDVVQVFNTQRSKTTRNRLNDLLNPLGWEVVQINHNWHLRDKTTYRLCDFTNGMMIEKRN
jgi:hypothetical protein